MSHMQTNDAGVTACQYCGSYDGAENTFKITWSAASSQATQDDVVDACCEDAARMMAYEAAREDFETDAVYDAEPV